MSTAGLTSLLGLGDTLLEIDEARFRQVVTLLEQMADQREVRETIDRIRPRLTVVRPTRRPTLKRLFCDPFEDLLEAPGASAATRGVHQIERALIDPIWAAVKDALGAGRMAAFTADLAAASPAGAGAGAGADAQAALAREFWAAAAAAMAEIVTLLESGRLAEALESRANPGRTRQARTIAGALSAAPAIVELKAAVAPKPLPKLHKEHLDGLQAAVRKAARVGPKAVEAFLVVAAARVAEPAMLLSCLPSLDLGLGPEARGALFVELSNSVVADIEARSRRFGAGGDTPPSRLAVADLAAGLIASLEATREALTKGRRSEFDGRLKAVRGAVHGMVRDQVIDGARDGIVTVFDAPAGAPAEGARDRLLAAEQHARALRKCAVFADSLGLRGDLKAVTDQTAASLREAAAGALGGPSPDPGASRQGFAAVRMIELMLGSAEAAKVLDEIRPRRD